jgi:hypothetical protein
MQMMTVEAVMCSSVANASGNSFYVQGDIGGKVDTRIFRGDSVGLCEKTVHTNLFVILNGYRDKSCLNLRI